MTKEELGTFISRAMALYALVQGVFSLRSLLFGVGYIIDLIFEGHFSGTFFAALLDGLFPVALFVTAWLLWRYGPRVGCAMANGFGETEVPISIDAEALQRGALVITGIVLLTWFVPGLLGGISGLVWLRSAADSAFFRDGSSAQFISGTLQSVTGIFLGILLVLRPTGVLGIIRRLRSAAVSPGE
jgi:hypothetical protein